MNRTPDILVLIPAYREAGRIGAVVRAVREAGHDVLVVDDGSDDATGAEAEAAGASVLRQEPNQGKGAALNRGFAHALGRGYTAVITMDADGQHSPDDLAAFVEAFRGGEAPVIIGNRMSDAGGMPLVRRLTNRFMSRLLSRRMGVEVPDTQNGYRHYATEVLRDVQVADPRFAAESEILLSLAGRGVPMAAVPVRTIYGDEKSKIHPIKDTLRFFRMLRGQPRPRRKR